MQKIQELFEIITKEMMGNRCENTFFKTSKIHHSYFQKHPIVCTGNEWVNPDVTLIAFKGDLPGILIKAL